MLSVFLSPSVTASSKSPSNARTQYSARRPPSSPIPPSPILSSRDAPSANASSYTPGPASTLSIPMQDILFPGDVIGQGLYLYGERVRLLPIPASQRNVDDGLNAPSIKFEVVKALGTGSHAVVYQVRQILSSYPPQTEDLSPISAVNFDDIPFSPTQVKYGREYALKCLSKVDLDKDALSAQMFEATIHQSLPTHPNIVTLYRTLETPSYLLLLLEYVPGQDLFYFLEQSCDHYEPEPPSSPSSTGTLTPPTPSLLSSLNPDQLLSRTRLRLISSMFAQMCQAVATCHAVNVFHRDIKPENFIVTDGWVKSSGGWPERKVAVKLTDFGLSANDVESADMDCGSAPYMSYECRNNVAPTYSPRAADVWSLGIVLINMLYHYNPWTDTAEGACTSFELYRQNPINFFMHRFTGMTIPVARFLATRVFCILGDSPDDSPRVSAEEFEIWAKDLPSHFSVPGHSRAFSISSTHGHPLAAGLPPSRPASRQASLWQLDNNALEMQVDKSSEVSGGEYIIDPSQPGPPAPSDAVSLTPAITKKPSKWKFMLSRSGVHFGPTVPSPCLSIEESITIDNKRLSKTASNVAHLVSGLSPPPQKLSPRSLPRQQIVPSHRTMQSVQLFDETTYTRGRGNNQPYNDHCDDGSQARVEKWTDNVGKRGVSPTSTRSLTPSTNSLASSNWRSSISTANLSTRSVSSSSSAFTRYSNNSTSTVATSVSSGSWRNAKNSKYSGVLPRNVKPTAGLPWELDEPQRQVHPGDISRVFGPPPQQKPGNRNGARRNDQNPGATSGNDELDMIPEWPAEQSMDGTTDLRSDEGIGRGGDSLGSAAPKKSQKGQIDALAKMLSALRR
ncbi:hypothetical protein BJ322DRAFT_1011736 [Thelephora terrestris]|uniref:non-specific serine/threonine protein kinase n=1 Tax=Thelephora terrestris TaxID=56493 RepID=A0A9P6H7B3_9AGAM|nr:hypothetical protein BJ322DRAFT_1011736 [Thelephora terrestris]